MSKVNINEVVSGIENIEIRTVDINGQKIDIEIKKSISLKEYSKMISDILDMSVFRPKNVETTALGAAYCAGLAVNFWKSGQEIVNNLQIDKIFTCAMTQDKLKEIYTRWKLAVERSRGWARQPDI